MSDLLQKIKSLRFPWRDLVGSSLVEDLPYLKPDLPEHQVQDVRDHMQSCLDAIGGQVAARVRAANLGQAYLDLDATGKKRFLTILAEEFGRDEVRIDQAIEQVQNAKSQEDRQEALHLLKTALEAPRLILLRQFNALPQGVKFLVDLRADLLGFMRDDKSLKPLERDLKEVLIGWFDVGFLELHRITWGSPAQVLEKIIEYEAVHSIQSWSDLKNRLGRDRRLFAFFHPRMPDEPLIFVEVALVNGMADNIQDLLDEDAPLLDPLQADSAIFYSISNAQAGLAGISFGNFLIKKVVDHLRRDLPNLDTFATLSPIPGFRTWLDKTLAKGDKGLVLPADRALLKEVSQQKGAKGSLKKLIETENWPDNPKAVDALKSPLMRLCARYLTEAKRKGTRPLDPVAYFHLSNGARMERLNWLGDVSTKGQNQSATLMINYLYKLDEIDLNHEKFSATGEIAQSGQIKSLVKN